MKKLISLLLFISINCFSADWKQISGGWLVDTTSIQRLSNGNLTVWFKSTKSPETITKLTNDLKKVGVYVDYSNYDDTLSLFEINCSKRVHRSLSGVDYSFDNKIINSYDLTNENEKFTPIPPDSIGDNNFKFVCKRK